MSIGHELDSKEECLCAMSGPDRDFNTNRHHAMQDSISISHTSSLFRQISLAKPRLWTFLENICPPSLLNAFITHSKFNISAYPLASCRRLIRRRKGGRWLLHHIDPMHRPFARMRVSLGMQTPGQ